MSLDAILEKLQLAPKPKVSTSSVNYGKRDVGITTLSELDDASQHKYNFFLGFVWFGGSEWSDIGTDQHLKRARLTSGIDTDYENDTSTADFALACDLLQERFTPKNVEIIMRATRYREKFDEMRGSDTYLGNTINNAISSVSQHQKPPEIVPDLPILSFEQGRISFTTTPTEPPTLFLERGRICIPATPPPPRDYVWQGRMVAGHAYVLGGFGGVSKSQAALQLAASIAMGNKFGDMDTKKGSALLIFGEDDTGEIERRLGAYAAQEKLSVSQRSELEMNIRALGLVGDDTRLTAIRSGALESTPFSGAIITAAAELAEQSGEPIRLIVLDHAGLFHGGDFNAREDVSLTMRIINHIAHETGAAVLLLAHSPKSASGAESSDASAIAGSTSFVDQTRGAFILATMRKEEAKTLGIDNDLRQQYVSLSVVKNNYGKTGEVSWFSRTSPPGWEVGVLVPVDLQPPVKSMKHGSAVSERIKQFIAANPGQYSKTSLRNRSGKTGELKASKPEVITAIEDLFATGEIITRDPTTAEIEKFGLTHQTKAVLAVPGK
jgi:hypothetical protein